MPSAATTFASSAHGSPPVVNGLDMKKGSNSQRPRGSDDLRPEYDFANAVTGKYAKRVAEGSNLVLLDPDIAAAFKTDRAVNRALRAYLKLRPST